MGHTNLLSLYWRLHLTASISNSHPHKSSTILRRSLHCQSLLHCLEPSFEDQNCPNLVKTCYQKVYLTGLDKSSPGHQRNLKGSTSFGSTNTGWNMALMSEERDTGSWRNLKRTPSRLLVKSGPLSGWSLSDVPLYRAVQSNTTCSFPGLLGLKAAYNWVVIS